MTGAGTGSRQVTRTGGATGIGAGTEAETEGGMNGAPRRSKLLAGEMKMPVITCHVRPNLEA